MTTASELVDRIRERIKDSPELLTSIGAVYQFVLEGDGGGSYLLDLKESLKISADEGPAACTVRMSATDFVDLFEGRANGQALFLGGKLRVEGDMGLALKLQTLTSILK